MSWESLYEIRALYRNERYSTKLWFSGTNIFVFFSFSSNLHRKTVIFGNQPHIFHFTVKFSPEKPQTIVNQNTIINPKIYINRLLQSQFRQKRSRTYRNISKTQSRIFFST